MQRKKCGDAVTASTAVARVIACHVNSRAFTFTSRTYVHLFLRSAAVVKAPGGKRNYENARHSCGYGCIFKVKLIESTLRLSDLANSHLKFQNIDRSLIVSVIKDGISIERRHNLSIQLDLFR